VGAQRPTTSPSATSATTQAAPRIARTATPSRDCAPARSDTTRALASASAETGDERTARLVASKATRQPVEIVQAILTAHDNGDPLNRVAANVQATGVHSNHRTDPEIEPFVIWTYANNFTGWNALLGANRGSENVSALAALRG